MNTYPHTRNNLLENEDDVDINKFFKVYGTRIVQESEKLFLREFLCPILGKQIKWVIPQYPFIDSTGRLRRIDFAIKKGSTRIALEVNGETYHAEGVIPNENFDDNLHRQNEILNSGWALQRFSYNQLQDSKWRTIVMDSLFRTISKYAPELISEDAIQPHFLQKTALKALTLYREKGWKKGVVVLPTGTGKTFLSAFDAKKANGKVLFIVHRLDILNQAKNAFEKVWPKAKMGLLTGDVKENVKNCDVLFASKDTLRNPTYLSMFNPDYFKYMIVDEVHHGQAPTYQGILNYFQPKFFTLGMTATPDRMDRKDIFELFDYNKVFEYTLNDAIENGFLVPYTYYGLKDNIDYSKIRYNGKKYNVQDLDKTLIIETRNQQILEEYLEKGNGNKGIGFCCSIKHANAMADFFNNRGIPAIAITSETEERDIKVEKFRNNDYSVAFTVDLFNEGMDFPEVRALLFLRPTESKTVFMQQMGRGLRLASRKKRVVILDFIGNYKKANKIRYYLSKNAKEIRNSSGRVEKTVYEYAPNCEVHFEADVETLLDNQDSFERGIEKIDLIDAYYNLAEILERKPTQNDINSQGEFKVANYITLFGSWVKFLREIGAFTEASYHYPQGLHLGHLLYILKTMGENKTQGTHLDEEYIRLRGNLSEGRLGRFQRQTKYKLQGMMEMGLLVDDRSFSLDEEITLELTPQGKRLYDMIKPLLDSIDLSFRQTNDQIPSWIMTLNPSEFNKLFCIEISKDIDTKNFVRTLFLETHAVSQMLNYLYRIERAVEIPKVSVYSGFFRAPFVTMYCDQNGIEIATTEGARHRCPFLLNILEALGLVIQDQRNIKVTKFLICKQSMKLQPKDSEGDIVKRINKVTKVLKGELASLEPSEESLLKETFGKTFLTDAFYLPDYETLIIGSE